MYVGCDRSFAATMHQSLSRVVLNFAEASTRRSFGVRAVSSAPLLARPTGGLTASAARATEILLQDARELFLWPEGAKRRARETDARRLASGRRNKLAVTTGVSTACLP
jgi:hypothetical protein